MRPMGEDMQKLAIHKSLGLHTLDEAFDYLIDTISPTVRSWDYFVNWEKVILNSEAQGASLELLQPIIGSSDFLEQLRHLIRARPEVIKAIPSLLVRDGSKSTEFTMLKNPGTGKPATFSIDFERLGPLSEEDVQDVLDFVEKTGLANILGQGGVSNVSDYLVGVEAGVDSNGRKNRGGSAMEFLVETHVKLLVEKNPGWKYLEQASDNSIRETFGDEFAVSFPGRRFDFAIFTGKKVVLMEVNFYSAGGSKLKATAGEFVGLHEKVSSSKADLVWITDGQGWRTAKAPLKSAFKDIDHVFNLNLLELGALEEVCHL